MSVMVVRAEAGRRQPPPGSRPNWLDRLLSALLVVMALAFVATAGAAVAGFRVLIIKSGSMTPTLHPGDLVISRAQPPSRIHSGDIVTFQHPALHALVTHRVLGARSVDGWIEFTTKGDANTDSEDWRVATTGRVGRAILWIPGVAPENQLMLIRVGSVLAIITVGWLLSVRLLRRIWRTPDQPT